MLRRALAPASAAALLLSTLVVAQPASASTVTAADLPGLLRVAAVDTAHPYDRDRFEHWIDADADGCNSRFEVLIAESTTEVAVAAGCELSGGTWVSPYDGFATTDPARIQIDHVVALAEAWRSGAWAWTDDQRRAFANDLGVEYALTAASGTANQSKADKDPAQWMPTNSSYACEYVVGWTLVKYRWSLAVDESELAALRSSLSGDCGATTVELPEVQATTPVPSEPAGGEVAAFPAGVTRLAGPDRYATALEVSRRYSPGVPAVFVATGVNFPDALSAAAAAAYLGGPLLLTPPNSLPATVRDEIVRLQPQKVYIAGDAGAVGASVESALSGIAPIERLGGLSRYDTANNLVATVFPTASHAFIATGRAFPDALAATGAAGSIGAPVVLVDGLQSSLASSTEALLAGLGVQSVTIVGSAGAVSTGIENQLASRYAVDRLGGGSRYDTAAMINDAYFAPGATSTAFLATGQNFPDALAGAALAGRLKSPVYISTAACVPEAAHVSMQNLAAPSTVALGSTAVVGANAAANLGCLTASRPTIGGSPVVGSTLTAYPGNWTPGTAFRYQWLASGISLSGATGSTLSVTSAMVGKRISVRVVGSLTGYATATVTSGVTSTVSSPPPPPPAPPRYPGYVTPGAFCAKEYAGWIGYTVTGVKMQCKTAPGDSRLRWRAF
ncbi:cell wall-binding repeat-containing protein [Microbacterium sp.]|uniref:cell wall-binding repeat-containing protein n=1 Tax=Microbacterium sp. TaxID=51671 RepID=UPI002812018F|nr:cell wall-binding repeat-containing protein [Microbacterium sp.]